MTKYLGKMKFYLFKKTFFVLFPYLPELGRTHVQKERKESVPKHESHDFGDPNLTNGFVNSESIFCVSITKSSCLNGCEFAVRSSRQLCRRDVVCHQCRIRIFDVQNVGEEPGVQSV